MVEVHPTEEASALNSEVAELPEVHFLDEHKRRDVDILLAHVLTAQNKHIGNFSDALNGYAKDTEDQSLWQAVQLQYASTVSLRQNK